MQRQVTSLCHEGTAHASTITEEVQVVCLAVVVQCLQLCACIESTYLCRIRDVHQFGLHYMWTLHILHQHFLHVGRREFAVRCFDGNHTMACSLYGPRLMYEDMARVGADSSLCRLQQGADHAHVGLCAAYYKENACPWVAYLDAE